MSPCWSCGVEMPNEHTRCTQCGSVRRTSNLHELDTMPGAPLIRPPKRRRISSHDLIPVSLREEYDQAARDRDVKGIKTGADRKAKLFWAAGAGAALTA